MPALPQRDTAANLELIPAVVMLWRREIWRIEGGMRVGRVETLGGSTGWRKAGRLKIHPPITAINPKPVWAMPGGRKHGPFGKHGAFGRDWRCVRIRVWGRHCTRVDKAPRRSIILVSPALDLGLLGFRGLLVLGCQDLGG